MVLWVCAASEVSVWERWRAESLMTSETPTWEPVDATVAFKTTHFQSNTQASLHWQCLAAVSSLASHPWHRVSSIFPIPPSWSPAPFSVCFAWQDGMTSPFPKYSCDSWSLSHFCLKIKWRDFRMLGGSTCWEGFGYGWVHFAGEKLCFSVLAVDW